MGRSGPFSLQRDRERALYHFPSPRLPPYAHVPFSPGSVCPSSSINFHQHHMLEHCMTEFRRQKATFSIPDGQLTSALNPKLHFPQILSAKHPCHAARFPQSAPESFRSLDTTPGRTTPQSRATRFEHPCSQTPVLSHPNAQRLLQGMSFWVVNTRIRPIPDLTRGIVRPSCQREEACAYPV